MSKPNNIRKKALDFAKKRQWDKALTEFTRLVEIEQHNPNVFNEIGDIQLKLGNKREAFRRYHEAIDAYAKVGLHNNAVAVCKKILRLNPGDVVVYGKLATMRKRQGFEREAVDYSLTFLERLQETTDPPNENARAIVIELCETLEDSPEVLERAAGILLAAEQKTEAGPILEKLGKLYATRGMTAESLRATEKMASIGHVPETPQEPGAPEKLETVETHRENRPSARDIPFNGSVPSHIRRGREGDASDFGTIEIGATKPAGSEVAPLPVAAGTPSPGEPTTGFTENVISAEPEGEVLQAKTAGAVATENEVSHEGEGDAQAAGEDFTATLAAEVKADIDDGDHRSHYDLGMAYLEMGLHADAIREFQAAATSPAYQLRSLEMIGHCLINQGQPKLAVRQLTKGLSLIAEDDRASLGLKYNLAVAYEMIGANDQAKALFEDVYVVDITFRDVQEKMKKYTS